MGPRRGTSRRESGNAHRPPPGDGDLHDNGILDYLDPGFSPLDTDGDGVLDSIECPGTRLPDATAPTVTTTKYRTISTRPTGGDGGPFVLMLGALGVVRRGRGRRDRNGR